MTIRELEEAYQRLRDQLLKGELDEEGFRAAVEKLRFRDELGNRWKIGWYTGNWYRYHQAQWIQGTPIVKAATPMRPEEEALPTGDSQSRPSLAPCLVIALVGLLLVASILLIFGWNSDWWYKSQSDATVAAAATQTEEPLQQPTSTPVPATAPSFPTPTATPSHTPSPTATQRPTRTPRPRTPTPSPTQEPSATPTVTQGSVSEATSTARVRPTATPSLSGHIYFPLYDPNPDRRTYDIYVVDLASGKREIMLGQASQPALSPDRARLVYRSWNIDSRGIRVRELSDENTWAWISFHEAAHASWSPDSLNLVFSSQQESDRLWRLYRTRGMEVERVGREGVDVFGRVPVWAADGRIIFWECPLGSCGLYAMQPDGTALVRLTAGEQDTAPAISPDGGRVAFMSERDGNWDVYAVGTHGAGPQLEEPRRLTTDAARDGLPTWSPNGQWLAFASDRGGTWAVWAMRPDGSEKKMLFELGGPLIGEIAKVPLAEQQGWTWESMAWTE